MDAIRRAAGTMAVALSFALSAASVCPGEQEPGRWRAIEAAIAPEGADEVILGRPLALALDKDYLYVADAQDCTVKIFAKDGRFRGALGRRGRGPGELMFPSGVCIAGGKVHVADKFNRRVQVFDGDGKPCGGFGVSFAPDKILGLSGGAFLVTGIPVGRRNAENMLHIYEADGRLRWEGLEARVSSDSVYDAFQNMILVCAGASGDFFVVYKCGERRILHFASSGHLLERISVDERYSFRLLDLPFQGPKKQLFGFCWAAAWDRGTFFLSAPAPVEGKDLGPGRILYVIDGAGQLTGSVELPSPVHRFIVDGRRLFAVDDDGGLRIFEVVR